MAAYKDTERNTWYVAFYYRDWKGVNRKKKKRGFRTKKEALEWEQKFKQRQAPSLDMLFSDFIEVYGEDMKPRLKYNTWLTKEHIIKTKLIPYFGQKKMNEIKATDIIRWQNTLMEFRDENGIGYSKPYLRTIQAQLSAIFNHAIRLYELQSNPVHKAGGMGGERQKKITVWTKEEYMKFSEAVWDKPQSFYAFEILYWAGLRVGDDDDKIRLNQRKPSKYKGLSRFGPEKNLQRINKFMKERPIFYKNLIQMKENFRFYLRCFYCITKVVILQFNSENRTELARNG